MLDWSVLASLCLEGAVAARGGGGVLEVKGDEGVRFWETAASDSHPPAPS